MVCSQRTNISQKKAAAEARQAIGPGQWPLCDQCGATSRSEAVVTGTDFGILETWVQALALTLTSSVSLG